MTGEYQSGVHGRLADLQYFRESFPGDLAENAASRKELDVSLGDNVFAHHARATSWFRSQEWEASANFAEESARLRKKDFAYDWLYIAMSHAHLGDHDEAQRWYVKSAEEIAAATEPSPELIELRDEARRVLERSKIRHHQTTKQNRSHLAPRDETSVH